MARKKNTETKTEENLDGQFEAEEAQILDAEAELGDSEIMDATMVEAEDVKAEKPKKSKGGMGASTGLLTLLLGGVAGVFAAPHIAPYAPEPIAKYMRAGDVAASQVDEGQFDEINNVVSALSGRIDEVEGALNSSNPDVLKEEIAALAKKLDELPEPQPASVITADGEAIDLSPIQTELDALKAQNAELTAMVEEKLTTTVAEAEAQVATAQQAEHSAAATMAIAKLRTSALDGRGIADDLQRLRDAGLEVPAQLSELSGGVDSSSALEADFGDHAINAIRASVVASSKNDGGMLSGITSQLSAQFAGRSTTPQEGATPDAILSRSEDHLRKGDLEQAISELSALPSEALAEMQPWIDRAENRLNLIAAIDNIEKSAVGN